MKRALALVFAATMGCTSYSFGPPPPLPPPSAPPVERCVAERRLTLSSASGKAHLLNETSGDGAGTIYVRGRSVEGQGFTFYRGQERLEVGDGLAELGDAELLASHERERDALSGAKVRQTIARPLWITLITAGAATTIVATTQLEATGGGVDKNALIVTGAGLGAMLLSIPFLYMDYAANAKAAEYDLRGQIYTPRGEETARVDAAIAAHRRRAERACGGTAAP